jgi:hypothetical protein
VTRLQKKFRNSDRIIVVIADEGLPALQAEVTGVIDLNPKAFPCVILLFGEFPR